ncbi:MAG TPA: bifunctional UDP-3-O-[3-hydroxymyristoyl] N-acetylglucosamine deacetylase/3-hydroxyacyl-ACP dehydratase, partial [Calditrichia bacterium]|nr:bifunctional UDP-3-O-[3-hydroxymyristoyl] N-acetylglucosamine deacetylase/3-hydroxyacyl-ACP dehydratase [Calditrichota bacterium]HQU71664.1 bifunctional UDP-3-O-[3-hydroxymyristoyl] N-acetylglucosamine deacetylase/3-hydroxyacyl-ACP dehydratase [Calditrichia bacterium]HQV33105.1 bifunctional UDP-3-O-[3-hydroxymyristoyl] N-acetylglucosamine deacetylase/3-hydroxyacyl-ACP dehydratase [Calditrichia bacterium]
MSMKQQTIKKAASLTGTGLHTGERSTITFKPAPENFGIVFQRTDLDNLVQVPALVDYVVQDNSIDSLRGTNLHKDGATIYTVEHVLAAVAGLQIDNLLIELTAGEPPVGDGSAMPYVNALLEAGLVQQDAPRTYLVIDETLHFHNEKRGIDMVALPLDDLRITVMIDYHNPALGSQHTGLFSLEKEFITEFAPSRTFCFLHEVEMLIEQGLIKGGNLSNSVVICDKDISEINHEGIRKTLKIDEDISVGANGILNNRSLRFKNEPARHKLLDLLGDLFLVGAPIKGQILAARPGHQSNIEFARRLREYYKTQQLTRRYQDVARKGVVFDLQAIQRILPHRFPFLFVDRITEFEPNRIVGLKSVTGNEEFFQGHFPGHPIMPGVIIIEAMAQTGGILLLNEVEDPESKVVYFMSMDNVRFRKPVYPGVQLVFEVELLRKRTTSFKIHGKAFVDGDVVAEADMMAAIMDR